MPTQKIKVEIEVPEGKTCSDENFDICIMFDETWCCLAFNKALHNKDEEGRPLKIQQCLEACENGMERGLEELAE